jgi:hypothetical protein
VQRRTATEFARPLPVGALLQGAQEIGDAIGLLMGERAEAAEGVQRFQLGV